ncbi:hypothetical protein B0H17DRAFT_1051914 [Mycena rosella]|uniref:Uncharacterized protein n=1 Tax=Mycena rosella TaxID=1033263 RepID=A0AAD7DTZ1_MYCRO|nr:hypothetical protein B0H17DRAFT_1051914 [Mycena rosella]
MQGRRVSEQSGDLDSRREHHHSSPSWHNNRREADHVRQYRGGQKRGPVFIWFLLKTSHQKT